jgi:hypothetical protein
MKESFQEAPQTDGTLPSSDAENEAALIAAKTREDQNGKVTTVDHLTMAKGSTKMIKRSRRRHSP